MAWFAQDAHVPALSGPYFSVKFQTCVFAVAEPGDG